MVATRSRPHLRSVSASAWDPRPHLSRPSISTCRRLDAITVSEANGRASIYLAALSSNLIALAFIGQMSRLGAAFYAFALILLPVLVFVGLVTFLRLVQSSLEDIAFAHRIALLRDLYLRLSPELEPYVLAVRGSRAAALGESGSHRAHGS